MVALYCRGRDRHPQLFCIPALGQAIGCSTAFVKARGLIGKAFNADQVKRTEYYREIVPKVDWPFMIIPGIVIGAFISVMLSGEFHILWVPTSGAILLDTTRFSGYWSRLSGGFSWDWAPGGRRDARAATASMVRSSSSLASMITAACFFAGGIGVAMLLFRVIGA